jgi:diacylglycerol kinase (ATP)
MSNQLSLGIPARALRVSKMERAEGLTALPRGARLRIGLIIRPREGVTETEELRGWVAELRAQSHEVWPRLTFEAGDGQREARALACAGAELVVAAGGDGTINEVVNGLVEALDSGWTGRLGVIPLGTGNDFAGGLGLPEEAGAALEVAVSGAPRAVDVASVNGRHFVNVSTGGFGVTSSEGVAEDAKRLLGPWAYLVTGVRMFVDLTASWARFTMPDGAAYEGEVLLYAVGNGKRTGGGNRVTPRALLDDGQLDVLIVPAMPRIDFLALLPDLRSGNHLDRSSVRYFRTPSLVVESEVTLSVNADGEPVPGDRFEYGVAPRKLVVMVPRPGAGGEDG